MSRTIFEKIVAREVPADIVYEDAQLLAFKDINPQAPVHALVIPKKHVAGIHETTDDDRDMLGELLRAGRKVAEELGLHPGGYRLVINSGPDAGQSVFHLHLHVLGGRKMAWPPG